MSDHDMGPSPVASITPDVTPDDEPAVISIQPVPAIVQTGRGQVGWLRTRVTTITRRWGKGESARCMLCPQGWCTAYKECCTITVEGHVAREDAKMFSLAGLVRSPLGPLGLVPEVGVLKVFKVHDGWVDAPPAPDPGKERILQFGRPLP